MPLLSVDTLVFLTKWNPKDWSCGQGCSVIEHLPIMHKALGLFPSMVRGLAHPCLEAAQLHHAILQGIESCPLISQLSLLS